MYSVTFRKCAVFCAQKKSLLTESGQVGDISGSCSCGSLKKHHMVIKPNIFQYWFSQKYEVHRMNSTKLLSIQNLPSKKNKQTKPLIKGHMISEQVFIRHL